MPLTDPTDIRVADADDADDEMPSWSTFLFGQPVYRICAHPSELIALGTGRYGNSSDCNPWYRCVIAGCRTCFQQYTKAYAGEVMPDELLRVYAEEMVVVYDDSGDGTRCRLRECLTEALPTPPRERAMDRRYTLETAVIYPDGTVWQDGVDDIAPPAMRSIIEGMLLACSHSVDRQPPGSSAPMPPLNEAVAIVMRSSHGQGLSRWVSLHAMKDGWPSFTQVLTGLGVADAP